LSISTAFTSSDLLFLIPGLTLLVLSLFFFVLGKEKSALVLLVAGAFSLRLLMIVTEPFINLWDEQFHALVARNMMNHLLHPVLYNTPVLPYDYRDWGANYTWLHKPPLFMWQMALSMKVFGIHPFAVRLPSAILSALCVPALYRIGFLLAGRRIGYLAALLLACSFILNTDHSDLVFMAYITFSIWSWTEYMHSGKKRWLLLTGLFSGMAILVKWLVGLLVYAGWGLALLANKDLRRNIRRWLDIGLALVCTTCVALPWHIYSRLHWPLEWAEETAENAAHLTHDMGHPGAWWYHFGVYVQHNGYLLVVLLIPGLFLFARSAAKAHFKYSFLGMIALVYVFFSFVQARMPSFASSYPLC
jgi:4-amino-4-deoxy-L-arabinose transferase-like glycosyltransferase